MTTEDKDKRIESKDRRFGDILAKLDLDKPTLITTQFVVKDMEIYEQAEIDGLFETFKQVMRLKFGSRFHSCLLFAQEYVSSTSEEESKSVQPETTSSKVVSVEGNVVSASFGKPT